MPSVAAAALELAAAGHGIAAMAKMPDKHYWTALSIQQGAHVSSNNCTQTMLLLHLIKLCLH
jgi:hypothetical protein